MSVRLGSADALAARISGRDHQHGERQLITGPQGWAVRSGPIAPQTGWSAPGMGQGITHRLRGPWAWNGLPLLTASGPLAQSGETKTSTVRRLWPKGLTAHMAGKTPDLTFWGKTNQAGILVAVDFCPSVVRKMSTRGPFRTQGEEVAR